MSRVPRIRPTVRVKLTALYSGLLIVSSAVLIGITYGLVSRATAEQRVDMPNGASVAINDADDMPAEARPPDGEALTEVVTNRPDGGAPDVILPADALRMAKQQRDAQMHQFLTQSLIAFGITAVVSVVAGWFLAGRALRKLRTITATARDISASNLHERLALDGPDDELKELGNTIDGLLARLESAFEAQRRFVANASHELRTPLARQRTLIQVALADPDQSPDSLRATHHRVLDAGREQEQILDALLALARGQIGLDQRVPFDLATVVDAVLLRAQAEADARHLGVRAALASAAIAGDHRLVEQLVTNVIDNAIRHNVSSGDSGRVDVETKVAGGRAVLSVVNSGPCVSDEELAQLFVPFRRLGHERTRRTDGLGLGLSIVEAIAAAHDATVTASANAGGGLRVDVSFPVRPRAAPVIGRASARPLAALPG